MNNYVVSTRHKVVLIQHTKTTTILHTQIDIHMYRNAHVE